MQRIAAVARFEFLSVVKRWSYLIATFGLPIFLAVVSGTVLGAQTYFLTQRAAESSQFGLVDESGVIDRAVFEQRDGARVWTANGNDVVLYDNGDAATNDLESGRLRAVYIVAKNYLSSGEVRAIQSDKTPLLSMGGTTIEPLLRSLLRKSLVEGRLDGDVQERVISPAYFIRSRLGPEGEEVTGVDEALDLLVRTTIPLFLGILLLTALLSASGYLVQTVSTDKESKIVEVLLSSVTPEEILAGKLFGLGAAGLVQFAAWSSMVVFVALSASAALASVVTIPWEALAVAPLLFILGYLFLGSLMLATAALGANAAESQKLTMGWAMLA
ncbi:MAG: ABC transporter permease, partial [Deltaproteobacteria bacterium]|nr:ABC transporter permease [Deltaproteobacteria bacterium]